MQKHDNNILFSASDLCRHLDCTHVTSLAFLDLESPLQKDEQDEEMQLLAKKGIEHEQQYLERLHEQDITIAELTDKYEGNAERLLATKQAMQSGVDVIFQAFLHDDPFLGYADFLVKTDRPSDLGAYSYEVLDTKLAKHSKPYYIIQLCLYSELLSHLQGLMPQNIHVALGDGRQETFALTDFYHYFTHLKRRFLEHVGSQVKTYPEPCAYCDKCVFRSLCQKQLVDDDHLYQVANIRKGQIKKLASSGIATLEELATTKLENIKGMGSDTYSRLKVQAGLQLHKRNTGENKFVMLQPKSSNQGLHMLPESNEGDLFFDIEGDPLYPDGLEYLFGVFHINDQQDMFVDLWSHDHGAEKESFEKLVQFFIDRLTEYPQMHIYHYASYEETALKRLMSKYGTMEAEVDHLLRNKVLVDLYKIVRHSLQVSEPAYSIKNLERFYMDREAEVTSAGASIVYYEKYISTGDQKFLDDILAYNLEDCRSLKLLQDWLWELRTSAHLEIPKEQEREDFNKKDDPHLAQLRVFEEALTKDLPASESDFSPTQKIDKLVFDLADFHRREAKPAWWRMFSRQTMTTDELIEDAECVGGLQISQDTSPYSEKQSTVVTYSFPEQEFKFKEGDQGLIAETLENAGTIVSLDQDNLLLQLKRGNRAGPLPDALDIVPKGPIGTGPLKEALWRFIEAYISDKQSGVNSYSAILNILAQGHPRIRGLERGAPLNEPSADIKDYLRICQQMDNSHLFIQGPPGTGKTYTASHLILGLVKAGKKVGVTANSHKVIHNLLDAVENRADDSGFGFKGLKKSSWSNPESMYNGKYIDNAGSNDDVFGALNQVSLVAGTAWLFSTLGESQCLDYLFIDEAGQISLANLIAMGTSAKNIVLVGDQMQLAQPTQGLHPGNSGKSVLDYLLQERHTIPPAEGILLDTTYRMHPKVCKFISEAVYDGRVKSLSGLEQQAVLQNGSMFDDLPESGLTCHFVSSDGAVQRSDEEAEHVKKVYDRLLTLKYRDSDGNTNAFTPDNVLVVSPYNMQVNNLKRVLGDKARVGTVDKFQGQEAEVVIVSMATSNPEEIPRGIDFLYSQNRLNVSLSRARAVSILVLSPQLLDVKCNTIEQMRLANMLCWASDYGISHTAL